MDDVVHSPKIPHAGDQRELHGAGQAQAEMKKAAEELAKGIAHSEPSAATASRVVGEQNEKGDDKAAHRQQMRDLKKRLGNMMLLSPCLLHSFNACNMNIIFGCRPASLE